MIDNKSRIFALVVLMLGFLVLSKNLRAQSIVQKGNNFIEQKSDSSKGSNATKTVYTYTDKKGRVDTIYLSKNGNAFVWRVSQKTGKLYRKYLPEVAKKLGTKKEK